MRTKRGWLAAGLLAVLAILGWRLLATPDAGEARVRSAGQLLGRARGVLADGAWVWMQTAWEQRDADKTVSGIQLAVRLEPESLYFLVNGARILAYDLPAWRAQRFMERSRAQAPAALRARWRHEGARQALALLERGESWHSAEPQYWINRAQVEWKGLDDLAAGARDFRRAAELPGAPFYAARLHADLLMRQGRLAEAHAWLCRLYPSLPPQVPAAESSLVLGKIRRLEQELGLPEDKRFDAGGVTATVAKPVAGH